VRVIFIVNSTISIRPWGQSRKQKPDQDGGAVAVVGSAGA